MDILDEVGTAVRTGQYRRLSPQRTMRLCILEVLLGRDKRMGHWSIARSIYKQLEDGGHGDDDYIKLVNKQIRHLAGRELITMVESGLHIRAISITDKGRELLRTLLELERSDYAAFLEEVAKL